jgi:hypothetical protein
MGLRQGDRGDTEKTQRRRDRRRETEKRKTQ